jgi:hypothetical protein
MIDSSLIFRHDSHEQIALALTAPLAGPRDFERSHVTVRSSVQPITAGTAAI